MQSTCSDPQSTAGSSHSATPWRYPPRRELQFGEWLRKDVQAGLFESPTFAHDLAIILTKVRQHSVRLLGPYLGDEKDDLASDPAALAAFVMHARQSIERLGSDE